MANLTLVNTVEGNLELEGEVKRTLQGQGYRKSRQERMSEYENSSLSRKSRKKAPLDRDR